MTFSLWVPTLPQTKGSTRTFADKRTGRFHTTSDNPKLKNFERAVHYAALEAGARPQEGAFEVEVTAYLPRPKSHFWHYLHRPPVLKDDAPKYPIAKKRKDGDKILRATLDALVGAVVVDDSQFVDSTIRKRYSGMGGPDLGVGVEIDVRDMP